MGETRVDLLHLLEDLRDAYPGALEETILTEIIANSLDSGASRITLMTSAVDATFAAIDNGAGMQRRELSRYHDLAATTKQRGRGIGFAGVGIKLGLLACNEVMTESKRGRSHVASSWRLSSRHRAPWKWVAPPGLVLERGTAVLLRLNNPLSPLLDPAFIEAALLRHYPTLFDPFFGDIVPALYPHGVTFDINGRMIVSESLAGERVELQVRIGRKRKPSALGYLLYSAEPLAEDQRGVAISTYGKVIRRGWDWLGISPAAADRITGLVEAPALAESLTLNKADFIRTGTRGATYLSYRKAIQEVVTTQLAAWGDTRTTESPRPPRTRPIERDLENVLIDLADDFPLLATLVEKRRGGQRRLPLSAAELPAAPDWTPAGALERDRNAGDTALPGAATPPPPAVAAPPSATPDATATMPPPAADDRKAPRQPGRYGLQLQFESRPDHNELGRLIESTVWINTAHPAYLRAIASRAEAYHIALTVAMSLAPLAVEPRLAHDFITTFLTRWGEAAGTRRRAKRPKSRSR
jgi:hypothetical protein